MISVSSNCKNLNRKNTVSNSISNKKTFSSYNSNENQSIGLNFFNINQAKFLINTIEEIVQPALKIDDINYIINYDNNLSSNINNNNIDKKLILSVSSIFFSIKIPKIDIYSLFERIFKYSYLDKATFISLVIYINRVAHIINIMENNIHKLLIGAFICAIKFYCDEIFYNSIYAKICGVSLKDINELEISFLNLLDFNLNISKEEYLKYEVFIN